MKTIALVAHDNKKKGMIEWCDFNKGTLSRYYLMQREPLVNR